MCFGSPALEKEWHMVSVISDAENEKDLQDERYYYCLFKKVWSCDPFTCNTKTNIDDKKLRTYI